MAGGALDRGGQDESVCGNRKLPLAVHGGTGPGAGLAKHIRVLLAQVTD